MVTATLTSRALRLAVQSSLAAVASLCLLVLWTCPALPQAPKCPPPIAHLSVVNGSYGTQPGVSFALRHFVANLVPMGKTAPACYGKVTVVAHGDIFISNESLTNVFTSKLTDANSKIKDFKIENGEGKVKLNGRINKVLPIAFTVEGPVTTDGTLLLLNPDKIKADGIPVKGLLDLLGEHLSSLLSMQGVNGVTVQENTLAFSPELIAHVRGHIVAVETSPLGLTLHYGKSPKMGAAERIPAAARPSSANRIK